MEISVKYLVETTGEFALTDMFGVQEIQGLRPSVVRMTPFVQANIPTRIRILEELADEADDDSLRGVADLDAAIAALPRPAKEEKPAPAPRAHKTK